MNVVEPLVRVRRRANLKENYKIALIDRGIVDQQIFLRAHFLVGNLNARVDIGSNHSPVEMIRQVTNSQKYDYYFGVIMCLAKPDVSLQRSKRKEFGHIVNPTFLNLLYEQYLRANYELTHSLLPIPYACLDFSADDPLGNTTLLTNTVESMASYFDINLRAQEGTQ